MWPWHGRSATCIGNQTANVQYAYFAPLRLLSRITLSHPSLTFRLKTNLSFLLSFRS